MHRVGIKVWRHIPIQLQIDPTGNHGVMSLEHKVSVYGMYRNSISAEKNPSPYPLG